MSRTSSWSPRPSEIRLGGTSTKCQRGYFGNWRGTVVAGANATSNFLWQNAVAIVLDKPRITASVTSNTNATGAIYRFAPVAGGIVDTWHINDPENQMFSVSIAEDTDTGTLTPDGKPYGVVIDRTNGTVQNGWIKGGYIDHTTVNSFYDYTPSGGFRERTIHVSDFRTATDGGGGLLHDNESTQISRDFVFSNVKVLLRGTGPCATMMGSNTSDGSNVLNELNCVDSNPTLTKPCGVTLATDGWSIIHPIFGSDGQHHQRPDHRRLHPSTPDFCAPISGAAMRRWRRPSFRSRLTQRLMLLRRAG